MTQEPPARWTDSLLRYQVRLLAISLTVVIGSLALWLGLARDDGRLITRRVAAGPAAIGPTQWELTRIFRPSQVNLGQQSILTPVKGATFVSAELAADLTQADGVSCVVILTAGEYTFTARAGAISDSATESECQSGQQSRPTYTFEVPMSLLDQIDGVGIAMVGEGDPFELLIERRPDAYPDYYTVLPGELP